MLTPEIDYDRLPLTICLTGSRHFPRLDLIGDIAANLRPGTTIVVATLPHGPDGWLTLEIARRENANVAASGVPSWSRRRPPLLFPPGPVFRPAKRSDRSITDEAWVQRDREVTTYLREHGGVLLVFATLDRDTGRLTTDASRPVLIARELTVPVYLVIVGRDGGVTVTTEGFGPYLRTPGV